MGLRHGSPRFYALLDEMAEIHSRKSHDYANNSDPYGNYHFAGLVSALFAHSPHDAGFAGRLAEKIYRISVLEGGGKIPKNESIDDTERDIAVIAALWMASRKDMRSKPNPLETELFDLIKLMPDSQTDKIVDFIRDLRRIRRENPVNQTATAVKDDSEEAACEIIRLDAKLNPNHRQQMIDYLTACQRDAIHDQKKDLTDDKQTFQLLLDISKMINGYLQKSA